MAEILDSLNNNLQKEKIEEQKAKFLSQRETVITKIAEQLNNSFIESVLKYKHNKEIQSKEIEEVTVEEMFAVMCTLVAAQMFDLSSGLEFKLQGQFRQVLELIKKR